MVVPLRIRIPWQRRGAPGRKEGDEQNPCEEGSNDIRTSATNL